MNLNQKFNDALMALISIDEENDEVCLIDGSKLSENSIELKCTHKFNYLSILNEINIQRKHNHLETQKISHYQIKCPYCRTVHNGILPYNETLFSEKINGVNWPPSKVLKTKKCQSIMKSGKRKGEECSKSCIGQYCSRHTKLQLKWSTNQLCNTILKNGAKKGEKCDCKCKKNSDKCGRHILKKSIKTNIIYSI
jgi:hypothetical protein|uniref:Uncharacterized protein n=1 Tax=viral metagenome TaxID=1070528 RepID=A0A6C0C6S3_9ZZZZ